jgi:hypothetical protein
MTAEMSHLFRTLGTRKVEVVKMAGSNAVLRDRVAGVLVGMACGDALGAAYEFGPPLPEDFTV